MNARQAWVLLAAGVLGYDVVCKDGQLPSECVDEWLIARPILTRAAIATLALHLGNAVPERYDVVSQDFTQAGMAHVSFSGLPGRSSSLDAAKTSLAAAPKPLGCPTAAKVLPTSASS
jgi:hypothetical protein